MIKGETLTLGNTVLYNGQVKHIVELKPFGVKFDSLNEESTPFEELDGVLLTEDWLKSDGYQLRRGRFGNDQNYREDYVKNLLKSTESGFEVSNTIVISRSNQNSWKITIENLDAEPIAEYSLIYFVHTLENIIKLYV